MASQTFSEEVDADGKGSMYTLDIPGAKSVRFKGPRSNLDVINKTGNPGPYVRPDYEGNSKRRDQVLKDYQAGKIKPISKAPRLMLHQKYARGMDIKKRT